MHKQVLIVDESATVRKVLEEILTEAGYEVTEAENGEQALACADKRKFDLLLADVKMPEMDGFELVKLLRKIDGYRFTPTIMLNSDNDPPERNECVAAGVSGWLNKPFQPKQVLQIIQIVTPSGLI